MHLKFYPCATQTLILFSMLAYPLFLSSAVFSGLLPALFHVASTTPDDEDVEIRQRESLLRISA